MARIDSLLAIVVDQGANELRLGSDREPKMFAHGVPKRLHVPAMNEQTIRDLLGDILSPERCAALLAQRPVEVVHSAGALGSFHVTLTARDGGGLDVLFLRGGRSAPAAPPGPPPLVSPATPTSTDASEVSREPPEPPALPTPSPATPVSRAEVGLSAPLASLVRRAAAMGASDLHLLEGEVPRTRIDGVLRPLLDEPPVQLSEGLCWSGNTLSRVLAGESVDAGINLEGSVRVRVHVYRAAEGLAAAIRLLPNAPPSLSDLGLPLPLDDLAFSPNGLVLMCGATGSGKSTTLAALAQEALRRRSIFLLTLEDPIEFALAGRDKSIVRRRLVGRDTPSFAAGLRDALREDPDVLLVGEMRDPETIGLALTAAETGHLVLASIHSRSSASAIDRIVDAYAAGQQQQIRVQLADSLRAILVQRLVPRSRGEGRVVAMEVLRVTHAVAAMIREGKSAQIPSLLQSSRREGMLSLERSLADRVLAGDIRAEDAKAVANDPGSLAQYLAK